MVARENQELRSRVAKPTANAVIANNPKLYEKKLWSEFGDGDPVAVVECDGV